MPAAREVLEPVDPAAFRRDDIVLDVVILGLLQQCLELAKAELFGQLVVLGGPVDLHPQALSEEGLQVGLRDQLIAVRVHLVEQPPPVLDVFGSRPVERARGRARVQQMLPAGAPRLR